MNTPTKANTPGSKVSMALTQATPMVRGNRAWRRAWDLAASPVHAGSLPSLLYLQSRSGVGSGVDDDLTLAENALRGLIQDVLSAQYGSEWSDHLGVKDDRVKKWRERREEARKRRVGAVVDDRLLFYADFLDLLTIINHPTNWQYFRECFGSQARVGVYIDRLRELRNASAHGRTPVPFERALVTGMSGELRQAIVLFRDAGGAGEEPEHFARIEEVTDSFGHRGVGFATGQEAIDTRSSMTLRPGQTIQFAGVGRDPKGRGLKWTVSALTNTPGRFDPGPILGDSFDLEWLISDADIHEQLEVDFTLKSESGPHRFGDRDDWFRFIYNVLPAT